MILSILIKISESHRQWLWSSRKYSLYQQKYRPKFCLSHFGYLECSTNLGLVLKYLFITPLTFTRPTLILSCSINFYGLSKPIQIPSSFNISSIPLVNNIKIAFFMELIPCFPVLFNFTALAQRNSLFLRFVLTKVCLWCDRSSVSVSAIPGSSHP